MLERKLRHDDNGLLRWMVDCCKVYADPNGNIRPVKPDRRKDSRRIDGVVAGIMSLSRAQVNAQGKSFEEFLANPIFV